MKKFLFSLILFISAFCIKTYAQQADSLQTVVDSLTVKVNTLEHQLEYLSLKSDLKSTQTDIYLSTLDIQIDRMELEALWLNKNINYTLLKVYRETYNTFVKTKENYFSIKDSIKKSLDSKQNSFTIEERIMLNLSYLKIANEYDSFERSLNIMNELLNFCEKNY